MNIKSLLAAAGLTIALATSAQAQIKVALDSPPDLEGSGTYVWAHAFVEQLTTNGIAAEEFQRGALGGDDELFDSLSQGIVEVAMAPLTNVGSIDKTIFGLRLPYFFEDLAQVDRALGEGGMLAKINEAVTPAGVRVLAVVSVGSETGIFNTKHAVNTMADMADLRMRALDESQIELFQAWQSTGVIVNWAEVPTALQTGIADGYINPSFVPMLFGHTDFIKHFTDAKVTPSLRLSLVSEDWYQGLSDADRKIVDDAAAAANAANRAWHEGQSGVLEKLRAAGVAVVELTPEARAEFVQASQGTFEGGAVSAEQIAAWRTAKGE